MAFIAYQWVSSSIPARSHTFLEVDQASIYGVSVTVQIQIRLASNQVLHCLLIEFIIIIRMKLLITTQQPLNSKWIRLIDKVSSFHYSIILSDGQVIYLISRFLLLCLTMGGSRRGGTGGPDSP